MGVQLHWKSVKCAKCRLAMSALTTQTGDLILVVSRELAKLSAEGKLNGCVRCADCKRTYCFDCSDYSIPCLCGKKSYLEGCYQIDKRGWWARLFGK